MNHPELLLAPVLMVADHLLTVAGARAREDGYSRHIHTEHYELNPVWQKEIARKRWFNPRHCVLVAAAAVAFYFIGEALPRGDDPAASFTAGMLLGAFGAINGRHLANLATFRYLRAHPDRAIVGTVTFSHEYVLRASLYQLFGVLSPIALLWLCRPEPMLAGAVAGIVLLMLLHLAWIARWRRRAASTTPSRTSR
ncbi:hypothetical protein [Dokdonella sp.]|uniref:hypothetical protein n=1 Tax=Dokdonella sp. TaxID=2291710 RepID=UPI002F3F4211